MTDSSTYSFQLGAVKGISIADAAETYPRESFFKDVDPAVLDQALAARGLESGAPLSYSFNILYLESNGHKILVDAGWGCGTQRLDGALLSRMRSEGIAPAEINTIIITHGDVDHMGGIVMAAGSLAFPNARYVMIKEAWEFWTNDAVVARWPAPLTVFGRELLPLIRARVDVVESGAEFLPGFALASAPDTVRATAG